MRILSVSICRLVVCFCAIGGHPFFFVNTFSLSPASVFPRRSRIHANGLALWILKHSPFSKTSTDTSEGNRPTSFSARATNLTLEFRLHSSIADISKDEWNECLGSDGTISAFLDHSWMNCLEESGCASPKTGWMPQHLSIRRRSEGGNASTIGFVPMYIKGHSLGEFIFDNAWADAAYRIGLEYYPKILVAVPFTPATGNRILWHPSVYESFHSDDIAKLRKAVAQFLLQVATRNNFSSVHINFMTESEATDIGGELNEAAWQKESQTIQDKFQEMLLGRRRLVGNVFLRRTSVQYQWTNRNSDKGGQPYTSFDDYLSYFKSKRRINIRRERRKVREDEGIRVDAIRGREILNYPGLMERMFEIYLSTIAKMYFGRQYLSLEFFQMLAMSDFVDHLCLMCARYDNTSNTTATQGNFSNATAHQEFCASDVIAGTFNVVKDGVFYGRYWGSVAEKEIKNLHFETCYWSAIEYCIQQGLQRMEPGAGGGDYKWARGFDPVLIHSTHYICHPGLRAAIAEYVDYETDNNVRVADYLQLRRKNVGTGEITVDELIQ